MTKLYAQIIIEISIKSLDKIFTYEIPNEMRKTLKLGSVVEIPFGAGNRMIKGYVLGFADTIDFDKNKVKYINKHYEEVSIESELIDLAIWMKSRYTTTLQTALNILLPVKPSVQKKEVRYIKCDLTKAEIALMIEQLNGKKIYEPRVRVLEVLSEQPYLSMKELMDSADVSRGTISTMIKHSMVTYTLEGVERIPYNVDDYEVSTKLTLNAQQKEATIAINESIKVCRSDIFLLHGITGSGKTEVYLQAIEKVIDKGASAIVMIPEIGLTPLMVKRFVERFGDIVGVMHSRLSEGEKFDQWRMAKEGKIKIMIGPRSAAFAPFSHIGLIILDEEHEMTYKSETSPKYHAREVAIYRGHYHKCPVILGSATPLVETYYKALEGKYILLELNSKAIARTPLQVETVDMRAELAEGNKSILSLELFKAITETLEKKEQIILFLNRRGHSHFVSCRQCGYVLKCKHCDVPYNYHKYNDSLQCHYCNTNIPMVTNCPNCGSKHIKAFGIGTQKVEAIIKDTFKESRVIRMDYDTTTGKHGHQILLDQFENHEADILIGTQMVAKGHHFDNVTLVGVLAADMSLYVNDFRASEKTFQLITQVTGRSGRANKAGRAIIQTYSPNHYSITAARDQDYKVFYQNEIAYRELMGYAPFKQMMTVLLSSVEERYIIQLSYRIKDRMVGYEKQLSIDILGPAPATLSKVRDFYRRVIYIKADSYKALRILATELYNIMRQEDNRNIASIQIDINPMMSY